MNEIVATYGMHVYNQEDLEKAEAIAKILSGMPIASALAMLDKARDYILGSNITV